MLNIKKLMTICAIFYLNFTQFCIANDEFEIRFGIGLHGGYSYLEPKIIGGWEIDNNNSYNLGLNLGADIGTNLGVEIFYSDLGEVDIAKPTESLKDTVILQSMGLSGFFYWPSNQSKWSMFAKLGLSTIDSELKYNQIKLVEEDDILVNSGIGVRWNFSKDLSSRFEVTSLSKDVKTASLILYYYF